jgi:hypothetical protein
MKRRTRGKGKDGTEGANHTVLAIEGESIAVILVGNSRYDHHNSDIAHCHCLLVKVPSCQ